jgi:hypothetical protein
VTVTLRFRHLFIVLLTIGATGLFGYHTILLNRQPPLDIPSESALESKEDQVAMRSLQTPNDAVLLALQDAERLSPFDAQFILYFWNQSGEMQSVRTTSLTLNFISRADRIMKPLPLFNNHLLRVDLRDYGRRDHEQDIRDWLTFRDQLQFDPNFSLLITKDTIALAKQFNVDVPKHQVSRQVRRKVQRQGTSRRERREFHHNGGPFDCPDGSVAVLESGIRKSHWDNLPAGFYYMDLEFGSPIEEEVVDNVFEEVPVFVDDNADVVRFNSPAINAAAYSRLQGLLHTVAPIVEHRYFKSRVLRTIKLAQAAKDGVSAVNGKQSNLYSTLQGGLYYEFRGIKKAKDVLGKDTKATDLDLFFENLGIGNIKAGVDAKKLFEDLHSDMRALTEHSNVAGQRPRITRLFGSPDGKTNNATGGITDDIEEEKIDIGDRQWANLLNPRVQAREAIFPTPTLPIFGLFNGVGALQDEVPFDVAPDTTIPGSYPKRLEAAISCLRCHYNDGDDGWKVLPNDAPRIAKTMDIFGDISVGVNKAFDGRQTDRLAGLYSADFNKNLRRNRDDNAEATLRATGPWENGGDQTTIAKLAHQRLTDEFNGYIYNLVDRQQALRELGLYVNKDIAEKAFNLVIPPDLRNVVVPIVEISHVGFIPILPPYVPEGGAIGILRSGGKLQRSEWMLTYAFAAERAAPQLAKIRVQLEKGK